ncbi:hypothetical protein BD289DRAFT_379024 [Coniella lustricola]|uniref:J domain-containing protein n=1 Tax=Coniella lustricola TaxID=2025994 RepID=A0A2T2ZT97_9PEZI|nr:hypothetical protein BD289DRAFT_379024 [Coniella lustricola]
MSQALSLIGWTFLPDMATRFLQNLYYNLTIRAGAPRPQPGHPRWAAHYRRVYILVICIYLAFTIYEADWELQRPANRDYYSLLGVAPSATQRDIKRRYRQLSALMHPDKVDTSSSSSSASFSHNVEQYIRIQTAHAVLADDAKRFAYDRFGPAIQHWTECAIARDFALRGARDLLTYYATGLAALYVLPKLGYFRDGLYWRYIALAALLVFELGAITSARPPWLLDAVVNPLLTRLVNPLVGLVRRDGASGGHPPYVAYQAVALARRMSISLSIALNQLLPMLSADTRTGHVRLRRHGGGSDNDTAKTAASLDELERSVQGVHEEAKHTVQLAATPFLAHGVDADGNDAGNGLALLRERVKRWLVDNTVRSDPMTKAAIHARVTTGRRRREGVPAGAQGNGVRMRMGRGSDRE